MAVLAGTGFWPEQFQPEQFRLESSGRDGRPAVRCSGWQTSAVEVLGIHHVALCVRDLDEALDFYRDRLGFAEMPERPDFGFRGAWLRAGVQQIHLYEMPEADPDRRQHVALAVDDLDAVAGMLESRGVAVDRRAHVPGAGRQAFIRDPTGNRIELNQPEDG